MSLLVLPRVCRGSQWGCSFDGSRLNFADFALLTADDYILGLLTVDAYQEEFSSMI